MKIKDVIRHIENFAPLNYQESYDNAGLIVGDSNMELKGIIICLDSIEAIVDEAIEHGCNMIVAHHPILFSGIKKLNGKNYIERVIIKAIKNDIAIYAAHTNLDNVQMGVNRIITEKLNLQNAKILSPKKGLLKKLHVFVPKTHINEVEQALFEAGAGHIGNYSECAFQYEGKGSFKGDDNTNPFVGKPGERHYEEEVKIEVVYPKVQEGKILQALNNAHPYEEVAYDIYALENKYDVIGSGMIGTLEEPMEAETFLNYLKEKMNVEMIRHTDLLGKKIKKVALCGGSGSFLLNNAISKGADIFITGDFKYHQFFDAEEKIIIADIGHYESEQFTNQLFYNLLKEKFSKFALRITDINTNPIKYF